MVLSNLSAFPAPSAALITLDIPLIHDAVLKPPYYAPYSRSGTSIAPDTLASLETINAKALPLLIDAFVDAAKVEGTERQRKGELNFLASVFANLSAVRVERHLAPTFADGAFVLQSHAGRLFFLTPTGETPEYPLAKLVAFTEHTDTIRRGGVISSLKNCAFSAAVHRAILSPESERVNGAPGIDALPYLLLPLAGPEEFDLEDQEKMPSALQFLPATKKREPDPALRLMLVETLLLLCTKRWGRDFLRAHGVYEVIRAAHLAETDDNVCHPSAVIYNTDHCVRPDFGTHRASC